VPNRVAWEAVARVTVHDHLFRSEVIEARGQRLEGEVILSQPLRTSIVAGFLLTIVLALGAWVTVGTYTRSEVARGLLVTDVPATKVLVTRPGRVSELLVREGDVVRFGQKIATVVVEQPLESGASLSAEGISALDAQRALAQRQAALASTRASRERSRLLATVNGIRQQRSDVAAQLRLQLQLVDSAKEIFDRIGPVMGRGFVSRIEYEARRQAWLTARQQTAQLKQQANALLAQEAEAVAQLGRVGIDAAIEIATAKTSAAGFEGQISLARAQRAYAVTAPIAGRVTALQAYAGRTVDASASLMEIVPMGTALHAEVYAASRAIGFVRQGQEVRLLFYAFPYQRFGSIGGRITRVSGTVMDPRDIVAPIKAEEPVYRIEIELESQSMTAFGKRTALQSGMALSANLILDRRSFADWLLQPIDGVRKRNR